MIKAWFTQIHSSGSPFNNYKETEKTNPKLLNYNSYFSNSRVQLKLINSTEKPSPKDKNILLIEVHNSEAGHFNSFENNIFSKLDISVINWLKRYPFVKIVVLESYESKTILKEDNPVIPSIELFRTSNNITNKIILQNCCYNYEQYRKASERYIPEWLTYLGRADFSQNNLNLPNTFYNNKTLPPKTFLNTDRFKYKFISYNGRGRLSRLLFLLKAFDSYDKNSFIYSYRGREVDDGMEWMLESRESTNYILTEEQLTKAKKLHENSPLYNLPSTQNPESNNLGYMHTPNPIDYKNVFVEVIGETLSWRDSIVDKGKSMMLFLTEKTLKPMLAYRPFLISGNPGHLKMLKELGFKTFDKWFDESYDLDISLNQNINIIHKNLDTVYSWSDEELVRKFKEMETVLKHNREKAYEYIFYQEKTWISELIKKW